MTIADRIQALRKARGYSQEELADKVGVSRQAVSKWESEQAVPDLDRVVIMSELFGVTTDYLLKGVEAPPSKAVASDPPPSAGLFSVIATAMVYLGVFIPIAIWYDEQDAGALIVMAVFFSIGLLLFGVGQFVGDPATTAQGNRLFWRGSIWGLTFLPLSVVHGLIFLRQPTPYPSLVHPFWALGVLVVVWLTICGIVMLRTKNKANRT